MDSIVPVEMQRKSSAINRTKLDDHLAIRAHWLLISESVHDDGSRALRCHHDFNHVALLDGLISRAENVRRSQSRNSEPKQSIRLGTRRDGSLLRGVIVRRARRLHPLHPLCSLYLTGHVGRAVYERRA